MSHRLYGLHTGASRDRPSLSQSLRRGGLVSAFFTLCLLVDSGVTAAASPRVRPQSRCQSLSVEGESVLYVAVGFVAVVVVIADVSFVKAIAVFSSVVVVVACMSLRS